MRVVIKTLRVPSVLFLILHELFYIVHREVLTDASLKKFSITVLKISMKTTEKIYLELKNPCNMESSLGNVVFMLYFLSVRSKNITCSTQLKWFRLKSSIICIIKKMCLRLFIRITRLAFFKNSYCVIIF